MVAVVWGFWGACMLLLVPCAPWVAWIHFGSILGVNGCLEAGFRGSWAQFRFHFGMPLEGPQAPGARFWGLPVPKEWSGSILGLIVGAKTRCKKSMKFGVRFYTEI